jgi:phospholipid/cholesterol/gamma-HCH transport system substrate-binding protein
MTGTRGTALRFGVFAVLTIGLTAFIGAQIAKIQLGDTYQVAAEFDDVSGLSDGDDVKIAGVKVGQVSGIDTTDDGTARVTLSLDEGVEVPADSEAAVRWRNLLGQRVVYLYPGQGDEHLADGDEVTRTRSVVDIGALIDELGGVVGAIDPDQFNQLITAVGQAVDGNEARVGELLDGAGSLLSVLRERDQTIQGLLDDFATVSAALADRDQQVRTMVENLTLLTGAFADNEALVDSVLHELGNYSTDLRTLLTGNQAQLGSIVDGLDDVSDLVVDRIDSVESALANFPEALDALFEVTNRGEFITVQALCFSTGPPPCPTPYTANPSTVLSGPQAVAALGPDLAPGSGVGPLGGLPGAPEGVLPEVPGAPS